jgi:two-component system, NarL family, sensor histidine kinase BarA
MEIEQSLPVIDWKLGATLLGNKEDAAKEILGLFIKGLPEEIANIKKLHLDGNYTLLRSSVHKLHGAICYCGTPRLKVIIASLETELKNNIMVSSSLFDQLYLEANLLMDHYSRAENY